jgi:hypothetical protein
LPDKASYGQVLTRIVSLLIILTTGLAAAPSTDRPPTTTTGRTASVTVPYLVVDMSHGKIVVELAGVALREYALTIVSDSGEAAELFNDLAARQSDIQIVQDVHLISAAETISEAELRIIAEETGLGADKIQRYIPGEMVLVTGDGLRMYVETDCPNPRTFVPERIKDIFRRIWCGLTGGDSLRLRLSAEDAMSLYGIARSSPRVTTQ